MKSNGVALWKNIFPTRALFLLLAIGFVDLIATAVLHKQGLIVELNPVMKPLIEHSEWLFAFVKGGTLMIAWLVMWRHCKVNLQFVRKAAIVGACAYMFIWVTWFTAGTFMA